jgi:membrane protein implicated in regulation of membrane protease activity
MGMVSAVICFVGFAAMLIVFLLYLMMAAYLAKKLAEKAKTRRSGTVMNGS